MFFKLRKSGDVAESILRLLGVGLACGSLVFAAHMTSGPGRSPQIVGMEHLAIYSRPSIFRAQRMRGPGVDFTPIGSTSRSAPDVFLVEYEILEANGATALLRLPGGQIARVAPGARLAGLGEIVSIYRRDGQTTIVTEKGLIRTGRAAQRN